jgi:hypothetical protein
MLEDDDFAVITKGTGTQREDLIPEEIWRHVVDLPDDVSIRTSYYYGTLLKDVVELKQELVHVSLVIQDSIGGGEKIRSSPFAYMMTDATDELQASTYNALTGYYRVAFSTLRNIVENLTVGLQWQLLPNTAAFNAWLGGKELKFANDGADLLHNHPSIASLEANLQATIHDDFFRQKNGSDDGGFARRLFASLSKYTHGRAGHTDADMRKSNGPIFLGNVFLQWAAMYLQVLAYSVLLSKLAFPKLQNLQPWSGLTVRELFHQVHGMLRPKDEGKKLYKNIPARFWLDN